jgi:hypothetical protein
MGGIGLSTMGIPWHGVALRRQSGNYTDAAQRSWGEGLRMIRTTDGLEASRRCRRSHITFALLTTAKRLTAMETRVPMPLRTNPPSAVAVSRLSHRLALRFLGHLQACIPNRTVRFPHHLYHRIPDFIYDQRFQQRMGKRPPSTLLGPRQPPRTWQGVPRTSLQERHPQPQIFANPHTLLYLLRSLSRLIQAIIGVSPRQR